jgi:hypothetical protein
MTVGDNYSSTPQTTHYDIYIELKDHLYQEGGNCVIPVFSRPNPSNDADEGLYWKRLELQKKSWYLGKIFMENYFTVFDNTPAINGIRHNYVGIAPCQYVLMNNNTLAS